MRPIARASALAALAGAAALAAVLALSDAGTATIAAPSAPLIARANVDPSTAGFGDRVNATITIELDRTRAREESLRLRYDLAPLRRIGPPHTIRLSRGDVELVTVTIPVACITDACLAAHGIARLRLAPVSVSIATAAGVRRVSAAWPHVEVRDRVSAADVNAVSPPVQADTSPLPPTYRLSPAALATILDVVAALLGISTLGLTAWQLERAWGRRRRAPEAPLARAIRLVRSAQGLPGSERRRALELLAEVLARGDLQTEATRLAWSEPTPEPGQVELLVTAIEHHETS